VNPIPRGCRTVRPDLRARDALRFVGFLERAFGAVVGDLVRHAEVRARDSLRMLAEAGDGHPATPTTRDVRVERVDDAFARALAEGAEPVAAPATQPYGDRTAAVRDHAGHEWWIATHVEEVTPEEIERRHRAQGNAG
jgi:PhnB protein